MGFDKSVSRGQSKARSFSRRLRGKKGCEEKIHIFVRDPAARIADRQENPVGIVCSENLEAAAVGHSFQGVDLEFYQDFDDAFVIDPDRFISKVVLNVNVDGIALRECIHTVVDNTSDIGFP